MVYCTAAAAECSYLLINRCTYMVDLILKGEVLVNNEAKITRCGRRSNIDTTACNGKIRRKRHSLLPKHHELRFLGIQDETNASKVRI